MSSQQKRVLVVDDEPLVCQSVVMMLRHCGYVGEIAHSGEEALSLIDASHFDLVLADLKMEGMQGDQIAHEIVKRKPGLPVVMITGDAQEQPSPDFAMVLLKPFALSELQAALAVLAGNPGLTEGQFPQVVVAEIQGRFSIQVFRSSGRVYLALAAHDQVVNETARILNSHESGHRKIRLSAPNWIRSELEKRGYAILEAEATPSTQQPSASSTALGDA